MKNKILRYVLIGFGLVVVLPIAVILVLASFQPDSFTVKRETTIKAPPEKVYVQIDDFHQWASWSPWEKLDPNMTRTFSGKDKGEGAVYQWKGNDEVGEGRMEIKQAKSPSQVTIDLHFLKPFEASNTTTFTLTPKDDTTQVVWEMRGDSPFMMKVMHLFMDMDSMIGKDFEAGLSAIKKNAESQPESATDKTAPPEQPDSGKSDTEKADTEKTDTEKTDSAKPDKKDE